MTLSGLARAKKTMKLMHKKCWSLIQSYCTPFVIFQPQHRNCGSVTFKCKNAAIDFLNLHRHVLEKVLLTLSLKPLRE